MGIVLKVQDLSCGAGHSCRLGVQVGFLTAVGQTIDQMNCGATAALLVALGVA